MARVSRVEPVATGANLDSAAERKRYQHLLQTAEAALAQGGEQGLQMKELAARAGVALATLYRYFPSKDHVLGAISLSRHQRAVAQAGSRPVEGDTAGERACNVMMREFRSVQREPEIANALLSVAHAPDRATSEYSEGVQLATERLVLAAIARGGEVTPEQRQVLPIFVAAASGAFVQWLAGNLSADRVRTRIRSASRLFDLPAEIVREYLTEE